MFKLFSKKSVEDTYTVIPLALNKKANKLVAYTNQDMLKQSEIFEGMVKDFFSKLDCVKTKLNHIYECQQKDKNFVADCREIDKEIQMLLSLQKEINGYSDDFAQNIWQSIINEFPSGN